jgi:predicted dehydrogenase
MAIGFGLIGSGFMGRAHAIALQAVGAVFDGLEAPRCVCLADQDRERASAAARALQFERSTDDWTSMLADPDIDVIDVCTPNYLHFRMALAALQAGKHVYCEKPLALDVDEAAELSEAARGSGRVHAVGFNYITNPMIRTARDIIASGEIGEPVHFSGRYFEDYMASPDVPWSWRCERRQAGAGALADLGSHLINLLRYLLGNPKRLLGDVHTVIPARADPVSGAMKAVENEDYARAFVEMESGLPASLEMSRVATGYKCGLTFEIFGTRGSIGFDQERMNELRLYAADQAPARAGYKTVLAGPAHADYARFCPAPGHGLGINDLKIIEVRNLLRAIAGEREFYPDFAEGRAVQRVMAAIEQSSRERAWTTLD